MPNSSPMSMMACSTLVCMRRNSSVGLLAWEDRVATNPSLEYTPRTLRQPREAPSVSARSPNRRPRQTIRALSVPGDVFGSRVPCGYLVQHRVGNSYLSILLGALPCSDERAGLLNSFWKCIRYADGVIPKNSRKSRVR